MKKKRTLLLIAVLVLFSAWYFWPRMFEWSFYGPQMVAEDFRGGAQITYRPIGGKGFQKEVLHLLVSQK